MKEIVFVCPGCNSIATIKAQEKDFADYEKGASPLDVFPYLTESEKETLLTGACEKCREEILNEK